MSANPKGRTRPAWQNRSIWRSGLLCAGLSCALLAGSAAANAQDIVIGASVPLSGPLAGFGSFLSWGYKHAVDAANQAGGIEINGKKEKIKLLVRDDMTSPNTTASNTETLITRDHVVAMLGSCTPALVNAGALVAERHHIPMVTGCDPLEAFKSVRKWQWVWDLFFDEPDLAAAPFRTMADLGIAGKTNKKIAILHDNGPDGQVIGGQFWPKIAKSGGYDVAENSSFPVDNTQFTTIVAEAKSSNAQILLIDSLTPQAVSIRKQVASAGYTPKVMVAEKGAEPLQFAQALGKLADGVMVGGYWDPSFPYPGAADLAKEFEQQTHQTSSQHIADSDAAAQILIDAIRRAGSLDATKINDAVAKTDKTYVVGPVKFGPDHTSKLPMVELQWQGGKTVIVWPKARATGKMLFPAP